MRPADAAPLPETPDPGVYDYVRLPLGGLEMVSACAFHPSGDYALVLEAYDRVHVLTWPAGEVTTITIDAPGRWFAFRDVVFTPDGSKALIVGVDDNDTGRIAAFDDAAYRAGEALPVSLLLERPGEALVAIEYPWDDGPPVVLGKQENGQGWIARLRDLDVEAGAFGDFVEGFGSITGCDDFAFVNNEFGGPGIYVICGHNGADHRYYTWLGGVGEWRDRPGTNNTGNFVRIAAHRGGDYALVLAAAG
ncbi:MAG: hypothetical protein KC486_19750, partial [Myxococcales bacterium]|nr:hypothetical protein [Myxococcales bacterium]